MSKDKGREIAAYRNRARPWGKTEKQTRSAKRRAAIKEGELDMDLKDVSDKEFRAEAARRERAASAAYQRQRSLEYDIRHAEYHTADVEKAAELGITIEQLEAAMAWADNVRDDRW